MNSSELRSKSEAELNKLLIELHREKFNLRMQNASGQLTNCAQFEKVRRSIARVNTILAEKGRNNG